uniref:ORF1 n=1 Tax=uncultured densovirus TaxID=748192 RepID=A0A7M4BC41_9VIRU|nr:ORF1 [uncultured densovirus]
MAETVFSRIREGLRLRRPIGYQELVELTEQGSRVGFARVGDSLYLAGDSAAVSEFADPSTFESFSEIYNTIQSGTIEASEISELAFDAVEINTTVGEATPLLATAGTAAVATSSTPYIISGVALAGAATAGIVVGAVSNSDDDTPIVTLPDHKFLGPGNTLNDNTPVDEDDHIALDHDRKYSEAKTTDDVHAADDEAIHDFITDVLVNKNPHSVLGALGIGIKRTAETAIGVQYPANLPSSSSGNGSCSS